MRLMEYSFSAGWFIVGLLVIAAGACMVKFFQQVTHNVIGKGIEYYDKVKLAGVITCGAGIFIALNLHMFILGFIARLIFGGVAGT